MTNATVTTSSSANATDTTSVGGLATQAWRKLRRDPVAIASALVMLVYLVVVVGAALGWVADDWQQEVAVGYAPPSWIASPPNSASPEPTSKAELREPPLPDNPFDPLAQDLRELREARDPASRLAALPEDDINVVDPLQAELIEIRTQLREERKHQATAAQVEKAQERPMGADKWGRDILRKTLKGAQTSFVVGLCAAIVATLIGSILGALAGYFGGRTDAALNWVYSVFNSIPYLLLILAVAAVLQKKGLLTIVLILGLTGWTGVFRLVRGEYMKHRVRDYVRAAEAIGASHWRRISRHILPNVSHVMLVQMSILTVGFIKSEVILSFLGFGVPVDSVSWGSMLNEAQNELLLGYWWQMLAASVAMAGLVTAFSLLTDALRDALDPKLK